ncbi:hypothetical protein L915_08945, partial [Phytophthora nicotianae]
VSSIAKIINEGAASVGEDPAQHGTHSFRSGGATVLFSAGIDADTIKQFGRWNLTRTRGT